MTAQAGDKINYKNNEYTIVALSNPIEFNPQQCGLVPESVCSACRRGYWCVYVISEENIILRDLYINSKDHNYPEINGITPLSYNKNSKEKSKYMGHHLYRYINMPMDYTGKILLGDGFMKEYYIHMGFQRAWAYKKLQEFIFEEGILLETIDHSDMAAILREEISKDPERFKEKLHCDIPQFVKESFSTDMSTKAWWIN